MNTSKLNIVLASVFILALVALGLLIVKSTGLKPPIATTNYSPGSPTAQTTPTNIEPTIPPFEQALSADTVDNLKNIKRGVLTSSILTNTYKGKIIKISTSGGYLPWANNFKFKLMLVIQGDRNEINEFYYSQATVDKNAIVIINFKVGDKISIVETKDLQLPIEDSIIKLEIKRIN